MGSPLTNFSNISQNMFPTANSSSSKNPYSLPQTTPPGVVPPSSSSTTPTTGVKQGATGLPGGQYAVNPADPKLQKQFFDYLQSMIGKGATPFNLQSLLPSGGVSGAGQLTAPENELLQQLQDFFSGKGGTTNIPGLSGLSDMANTGDPISALPAWQAMTDAQQRQIQENAANLKEQFAFSGNLASSPMAAGMSDYYTQTSKDQNATLAQMQQQALEAAEGRKMGAQEFLGQEGAQLSQYLQGLDQASIDRLLQEFIRTQPEYSPLLGLQGAASGLYPPTYGGAHGTGIAGALIGAGGDALSQILSHYYPSRGGGGAGGSGGSGTGGIGTGDWFDLSGGWSSNAPGGTDAGVPVPSPNQPPRFF